MVEGTLLDPDDASYVWQEGEAARLPIDGISFRLEGIRGDTVDLHFADDDEIAGWMRLTRMPRRAQLTLHGVWFEDGRAFATSISTDGAGVVEVNGLRMADPSRLPVQISTRAVLLSRARSGNAFVARPLDDDLPDLRVLVVPVTSIRTVDGDPTTIERLSFGDTLQIEGEADGGYVVATEIIAERGGSGAVAGESGGSGNSDGGSPGRASSQRGDGAARASSAPGSSGGSDRSNRDEARERRRAPRGPPGVGPGRGRNRD